MWYKLIDKCSPCRELWTIQLKRAKEGVQSLKIAHPWCFNHFPLLLFNLRHLSRKENIRLLGIPLWSYKGCKSGLRHGELSKKVKTHTVAFLIYCPVFQLELENGPWLHLTMLSLMDMYLIWRKLGPYALDTLRIAAETKRLIFNLQNYLKSVDGVVWRRKQKRSWACHQEEGSWWILWFVLLAHPEEWDPLLGFLIQLYVVWSKPISIPEPQYPPVIWKDQSI